MPNPINERFSFFYGGFMSQWIPSRFLVEGVNYANAEQYMMAGKAKLFGDTGMLEKIMRTTDPYQIKMEFGRNITPFDPATWNAVAREIVFRGNIAKFSQNPVLLDLLYGTIGTTIVEASPTDTVWGIGMAEYDLGIEDRSNWRGTNWLGEVLMEVRDALCVQ